MENRGNSKMVGFKAADWIHEAIAKTAKKYGISKGEFIKDCIKERLIKEELKCQRGTQENQPKDY
jgi:hypothetical protein